MTDKKPGTVVAAKIVEMALVTYVDDRGIERTTLAVIGSNNVHLFNARDFGFSKEPTFSGPASELLSKNVLKALHKLDPRA